MSRLDEVRAEVIELENEVQLRKEEIDRIERDIRKNGKQPGLGSQMELIPMYKAHNEAKERLIALRRFL